MGRNGRHDRFAVSFLCAAPPSSIMNEGGAVFYLCVPRIDMAVGLFGFPIADPRIFSAHAVPLTPILQ